MSFSVAGRNAIVTGAASGINLAFTKLLVSKGCKVVIADIAETPMLEDFLKGSAGDAVFKKTDVSEWKQLDDLFSFAKSTYGAVDLMCNGAGVYEPSWSNFWTDTEETSYKTIDINLSSVMRGTRLAIRDQVTRSKGHSSNEVIGVILNVSSLAAQFALFNQPLYGASKAGVSSFTRSLAPLHPEFGIKVVAVSPGMVRTPLWTDNPDKMKAISEEDVILAPEELAEAMLLLVESDSYPGGTVLEVLKDKTRIVKVDSSVAEGPGATMGNMHIVQRDTIAILKKEQAAGLDNA